MPAISTMNSSSQSYSNTSNLCNSCHCGRDSMFNLDLPIHHRGQFFQDAFFSNSYDSLDTTIRRIMERWGASDIMADSTNDIKHRLFNNLSRYRQMRTHNLREEDQAVTITNDQINHKIVMDVSDFVAGEVKIKVVGEREVMVEGSTEINKDFTMSCNRFRRRFILPQDTNMKEITSVMSSDGVLTITAPRMVQEMTGVCTNIPIHIEGSVSNGSTSNHVSNTATNVSNSATSTSNTANMSCHCQSECQRSEAQNISSVPSHNVPIKVDSEQCNNQATKSQEMHNYGSTSTIGKFTQETTGQTHTSSSVNSNSRNVPIKVDKEDSKVTQETTGLSQNTSNNRNVPIKLDSEESKIQAAKSEQKTITHRSNANNEKITQEITGQTQNASNNHNVPIKLDSFLPISRRGHFFEDSYFEGLRQDFQKAVNDVLTRWGDNNIFNDTWNNTNHLAGQGLITNNLNRYRQIRSRDLTVDNQAVNITSDNNSHKVVVDVAEFVGGDVKVKIVGNRQVMIEGRKETHEGQYSVFSNTFKRSFCLPQDSNMDSITSVMSSDGILTITVPRTTQSLKNEETLIPITVEGNESNVNGNTNSNIASKSSLKMDNEQSMNKKQETETTFLKESKASSSTTNNSCQNTSKLSTNYNSTQTDGQVSGQVGKVNSNAAVKTTNDAMMINNNTMKSSLPSILPVTTRGLFFNDSFFKDTWQDFQDAIKDVMSRFGNLTSTTDHMNDLTHYRTLRTQHMTDATQAIKSSEDELNYKIVLDVKDFTEGGTINVKSVNEREVVVEGAVNRNENGVQFKKQFHRRFVLPQDIYLDSVSSDMSSDGVLTITAPKKPVVAKIREMIIPVSIEEGIHKSESFNNVSDQNTNKKLEVGIEKQSFNTNSQNTTTEAKKVTENNTMSRNVNESCVSKSDVCETLSNSCTEDDYKKSNVGWPINQVKSNFNNVSVNKDENIESQKNENVQEMFNKTSTETNKTSITSIKSDTNKIEADTTKSNVGLSVNQVKSNNNSIKSDALYEDSNSIKSDASEDINKTTTESETNKSNVGWSINQVKSNFNKIDAASMTQGQCMSSICKKNVNMKESSNLTQDKCQQNVNMNGSSNLTQEKCQQNVNMKSSEQNMECKGVTQAKCDHISMKEFSGYTQGKCVPIINKGSFYTDSFFENIRHKFTDANQQVLQNNKQIYGKCNDMTSSHCSVLSKNPQMQNQPIHKYEDETTLKYVLDVSDFGCSDVKVTVVDEKQLVVEGDTSKNEGNSSSSMCFRRKFTLPNVAEVHSIMCAMSCDGVLIITIPKSSNKSHQQDTMMKKEACIYNQEPKSESWAQTQQKKETKETEAGYSHSSYSSYQAAQKYSSNNTF